MKKRVLSLLLVVAMLASLVVFPAYATGTACVCGCGATDVKWEPWTGELVDGKTHYVLQEDIVTPECIIDGEDRGTYVLDLNGHVWRAAAGSERVLKVGDNGRATTTFTILDTSKEGTGEMQATSATGVGGGVVYLGGKTTLNIKGGTLRMLYDKNIEPSYAGVLRVNGAEATVNMSGGVITDGDSSRGSSEVGGNVRVEAGTFKMTGGKIVKGLGSFAGGVYINSGATFEMSGGEISGNVATASGGNIYNLGTLKISGAAVIKNGVARNQGANIYNGGTMTLENVTLDGDIYTTTAPVLKGAVKINMGNSNGLLLASGVSLDVSQMDAANSRVYFGIKWAEDQATATFTNTGASAYSGCFLPVVTTTNVAAAEDGALTAAKSAAGSVSYCPHCGEGKAPVAWGVFSDVTNTAYTHFYCDTTDPGTANVTVAKNATFVLDLNGQNQAYTLNAEGKKVYHTIRRFLLNVGCKFALLDSIGGGQIAGGKSTEEYGGVIRANNEGTTTDIYSGTITGTSQRGGIFLKGGTINVHGGIFENGQATVHNGGNICLNSANGAINIYGGYFVGGSAASTGRGGNIYSAGPLMISGGIFDNGKAGYNGGNIGLNYADYILNCSNAVIRNGQTTATGTGLLNGGNIGSNTVNTFNFTNCTIAGGTSPYNGGNIGSSRVCPITIKKSCVYGGSAIMGGSIYAGANLTLENSTISGGTATTHGGNIYLNGGYTIDVDNCSISGGSAGTDGGNIYVQGAKFDMIGSHISNGVAKGNGGNLFIGNNVKGTDEGPVLLTNCTFENGHAYTETDERHESSDNIYADSDIVLDGVQVSGNSGQNELGSGVYALKNVTLKNNTVVGSKDEPISGSLYLKNAASSLEVDESFSGTVVLSPYWLFVNEETETVVDPETQEETEKTTIVAKMARTGFEPYGQILDVATSDDFAANGGKLYLGDHKTSEKKIWAYGMPEILYTAEGLQVASGATLVNAAGTQFFKAPADAFTNYADGDVLKLVGNLAEGNHGTFDLKANTAYIIDMNGKVATVNGDATNTIYGLDSANAKDLNNQDGGLTVHGAVKVEKAATGTDGKQYVALNAGDVYSFHYIKMDITKVTLRTSSAGIFYKGQWNCDAELADFINKENLEYGVVVSRVDMPDENFATEESTMPNLYSTYSGNFVSGVEKTGAIVSGIFKEGNDAGKNTENADVVIYARAYLNLGDGKYIVDGEGAQLSMMNVLQKIDEAITADPEYTTQNQTQAAILMNDFYAKWADKGLTDAIANYAEKYEFVTIFQPEA